MPPKAAAASEGTPISSSRGIIINGVQLTAAESRIAAAILETSKMELDWPKIAEKTGHKTPKGARDGWRLIRIKCNINTDDAAGSAPASAKKAAVNGTDSGEAGTTPVKRSRGRPPKKTMMLTPGANGDEGDALVTPGSAMANLSFGDMTPETPSKTASGTKRSADDTDPDAIIFEETPAKKKATPRKRLTAKQKAEKAAAEAAAEAAAAAALAAPIDEPATVTTSAGFEPASSPAGANGDGDNIDVAMDGLSQAEQAIGDILAADAADAAALVGGIDPGEI